MLNIFNFKKIIFIPLLILPLNALANITMTPKRVVFEKGQKVAEVMLINRSAKEEKFRILLNNQRMLEDGTLADATEEIGNDFFGKQYLIISPRQVTLAPKGTQKIRVMSRLRNNAPDGEYRTHLLVQNIPDAAPATQYNLDEKGVGVSIRAIFGMSLPVIIRKGDLSADISLSDPKFISKGEGKFVEFTLNRKGDKSVIGDVELFSGENRLAILKNLAIYLSNDKRFVSLRIAPEKYGLIDKDDLQIVYSPQDEQGKQTEKAELRFNIAKL